MSHIYKGCIGTYSKGSEGGIFRFEFDGAGIKAEPACDIENPSFLCFCDGGILAVSETNEFMGENGGSLAYIKVDDSGKMSKITQVATGGKSPCFVDEAGGTAFAANYSEGTATIFSFSNGVLSKCKKAIVHFGKGTDPERQECAHIHCTVVTPDKKYIAVCDLGIDKVVFYTLGGEKVSEAVLPSGAGPRHIAFNGGFAYVVTELSSEVFAYFYNDGNIALIASYKLLPEGFCGFSNAAAIKISPCKKFITASNRGHNSLTTFKIKGDGSLSLLCRASTGGDFPRDFAYTPDGKHILCANQNSNSITVLSVNNEGKTERAGSNLSVPSPVMILFDSYS